MSMDDEEKPVDLEPVIVPMLYAECGHRIPYGGTVFNLHRESLCLSCLADRIIDMGVEKFTQEFGGVFAAEEAVEENLHLKKEYI